MRAIILVAAWCICDAINKDWVGSDKLVTFMAITFLIAVIMDLCEFVKKLLK